MFLKHFDYQLSEKEYLIIVFKSTPFSCISEQFCENCVSVSITYGRKIMAH